MKIGVIGLGYLGATHAAVMADLGFEVIGIEPSAERAEILRSGKAPFFEPGLDELLKKHTESGQLVIKSEHDETSREAEVFFICVGTPQSVSGLTTDKSFLYSAIDQLAPYLSAGALVVGKSTVPVGTAAELQQRLAALVDQDFQFAWNPEFLREGKAVQDTRSPDRLVFGADSDRPYAKLREVYATTISEGTPVIETDLPSAELVKVAANSFLATKISFINAIAEVAETVGADVTKIADAIGLDDRIGRKFLNSGIGFGGGCLPKDIRSFIARSEELGLGDNMEFLRSVDQINLRQRDRVVQLVEKELGGLAGKKITVLGGAFKPDSDDIRDSPALGIASRLAAAGAKVVVHDYEALENVRRFHPELETESDLKTAFDSAEAVLHLTEWKAYRELDPAEYLPLVANPFLLDGRNALNLSNWKSAGWKVYALGRGLI